MRAPTLFGLLVAAPCIAVSAAPSPQMSGEALVKLMGNVDPAQVSWSPTSPFRTRAIAAEYIDMSNGEFVRGFIQGVYDTTQGKEWCPGAQVRPMPHEMDADARSALQRLPAAQLKMGAADLIVAAWRKSWPCSTGKRRGQ
jgi:hypothetical protein